MARREVKGLHRVVSKGRVYWYAWRGRDAPRIHGEYGTAVFWASYDAAIRERHVPEPGKFRALVTLYRSSTDYEKLAPVTKRNWGPWLDRIAAYFGPLSIAAFDNPKVRKIIRQWRTQYAETPRAADMGMQVLSRVCAYAVEQGTLTVNPCEGITALYSADRAAIIWTDADIARIKAAGSPELGHAIDLAALSGLRRGDLLRLSWSHVLENEICIPTNKSGRRVEARNPALFRTAFRAGAHPEAGDHDPNQLEGAAVDRRRLWLDGHQGQGWNRRRASLSRPERNGGDQVLFRRIVAARHRRNPRLDRRQRRHHHPQVCRSHRCDRSSDSAAR
jgi:hypothetical protein